MARNDTASILSGFGVASASGSISSAEVKSLVKNAAKDGLTKAEARALAEQSAKFQDAFEPAARTQLSNFLSAASAGANTEDPMVMTRDAHKVKYRVAHGVLFKQGISANDIKQGMAGDCYFLASLAALAKGNPAAIRDAITVKEDGSYLVRFYRPAADGTMEPVYIPVDKELPRDRWGSARYASGQRGELWVPLMEKAFAKFKGSYEAIGNGGWPSETMSTLTGQPAKMGGTDELSPTEMFATMKNTLAAGRLVCASTGGGAKYRKSGLVTAHAYSVLGVSERNGVKYVTLRNPWGFKEPGQPDGGDGVFKLTLSKFLQLFPEYYATEAAPATA